MYTYNVEILRVVDGDTVDVLIDLGFGVRIKERVRLYGIDAPESRTTDLVEKEKGLAATAFLEDYLNSAQEAGVEIILVSNKFDRGKYGRVLGTFYIAGIDMNEYMIQTGHARSYAP